MSFSKYKNVQIQDLKMGEGFSIALSKQGEVFAWGMNDQGQLGKDDMNSWVEPEKVPLQKVITMIACGLKHCVVVDSENQVYAWGSN